MSDLARFAVKIDRVASKLTSAKMLQAVGMEGKKIATKALQDDVGGDTSMSNWRRGKPSNLTPRFDVTSKTAVEISPTKRGAGPWRVLEEGRKAGMSRGSKKRAPRQVSASRGKGTWSSATEVMERDLIKIAERHTNEVLREHFLRGF